MNTRETIEFLWHIQTWQFDYNTFKILYIDESMAKHMWNKYVECDYNLLRFWRTNDSGNQAAIMEYITSPKCIARYKEGMMIE